MITTIEVHYLPPTWVIAALSHPEDRLRLEGHEHYQKGSFRNRCLLDGANGIQSLYVPLEQGKNQGKNIKDVKIAWSVDWHKVHWKTIKSGYGNAPFFPYYEDGLRALFDKKPLFLWDWNLQFYVWMLKQMNLPGSLEETSGYQKHIEIGQDFRHRFKPTGDNPMPEAIKIVSYPQVFGDRHPFLPGLSGLDMLFCVGPSAISLLKTMRQNISHE